MYLTNKLLILSELSVADHGEFLFGDSLARSWICTGPQMNPARKWSPYRNWSPNCTANDLTTGNDAQIVLFGPVMVASP